METSWSADIRAHVVLHQHVQLHRHNQTGTVVHYKQPLQEATCAQTAIIARSAVSTDVSGKLGEDPPPLINSAGV